MVSVNDCLKKAPDVSIVYNCALVELRVGRVEHVNCQDTNSVRNAHARAHGLLWK